jgi:hypothetical protein
VTGGLGGLAAGAWPPRFGKLLPLQVLEEQSERAIDDLGHVSVGNGVPEEILGEPQLLAGLSVRGEADLISVGCERGNEWRSPCRYRMCRRRMR